MSINDNFNRADSAVTLGAPWTVYSGTWGIASNRAYLVSGAGSAWNVAGTDCGSADGEVSVKWSTAALYGGIAFRIVDDSNYFMVSWLSSGVLTLFQKSAGSFVELKSSATGTSPSDGDLFKVSFRGYLVTVTLNGVEQLSYYLASRVNSSIHGMVIESSATATRFDDFSFLAFPPPTKLVVCIGDSRTFGLYATSGSGTAGGTTFPADVQSSLGINWLVLNKGVNTDTVTLMIARVSPAWFTDYSYTDKVAVVWGGINDSAGGADAATIHTRLINLVTALRSAGASKVYVCTEISGNWEATRTALNTLIAGDSCGADGIVPLAADPLLSNPDNAAIYDVDRVHFTDAGFVAIAGDVVTTVSPTALPVAAFSRAFGSGFRF